MRDKKKAGNANLPALIPVSYTHLDPWERIRHTDADTGTDVCIYHFEGGAGVTGRI